MSTLQTVDGNLPTPERKASAVGALQNSETKRWKRKCTYYYTREQTRPVQEEIRRTSIRRRQTSSWTRKSGETDKGEELDLRKWRVCGCCGRVAVHKLWCNGLSIRMRKYPHVCISPWVPCGTQEAMHALNCAVMLMCKCSSQVLVWILLNPLLCKPLCITTDTGSTSWKASAAGCKAPRMTCIPPSQLKISIAAPRAYQMRHSNVLGISQYCPPICVPVV